jgi:hypothetical protein
VCLKWEALLAEGERPRALGSMVVCEAQTDDRARCEADAILEAFGNTRAARAKVQCWQLGVSLV